MAKRRKSSEGGCIKWQSGQAHGTQVLNLQNKENTERMRQNISDE